MVAPLLTVIDTAETEAQTRRATTLRELAEILATAYVERGAEIKITVEVQERHWARVADDYGPVKPVDSRTADVVLADDSGLISMTLERGI